MDGERERKESGRNTHASLFYIQRSISSQKKEKNGGWDVLHILPTQSMPTCLGSCRLQGNGASLESR